MAKPNQKYTKVMKTLANDIPHKSRTTKVTALIDIPNQYLLDFFI